MARPHRDPNRCPSHPGAVLRDIVLPALDATKVDLAEALEMSRNQLYAILAEKQPVMPGTAVRLERVVGGSARSWLNMQSAYDLWWAERSLPKKGQGIKLAKDPATTFAKIAVPKAVFATMPKSGTMPRKRARKKTRPKPRKEVA